MADEPSKRAVNTVLQLASGLGERHPNQAATVLETL